MSDRTRTRVQGATCTFCGQPVTGESPDTPDPCEYCGSPGGGYPHSIIFPEGVPGSASALVEGATHPRILLRFTRFLLDRKDDKLCGVATIMAHLACEVAVERSLFDTFARRGIPSVGESVSEVLNGYNLASDKVRNLYASLTGDDIREQPFWSDFVRSARRRDDIIRKGLIVGREDAEESLKTAGEFLAHLEE